MATSISDSVLDPGVDLDKPLPSSGERNLRFVTVRADLMPSEVITARAADRMRYRVVVGLAALVAVLVLGYGFSWWQTHSANNDLAGLQRRSAALNAQTDEFGPLVQAQSRTASIHAQLAQLMTGDLSWRSMLTTLRSNSPAGTTLSNVTGSITTGTAGLSGATTVGGYSALNESGQLQVGTLTITGVARDKRAVARYADDLAKVKGLAAPTPTSVSSGSNATGGTTAGGGVTFTIDVIITSDALGGRYSAPAAGPSAVSPSTVTPTTGGN